MLPCAYCGQPGASFCSNDGALYHPFCLARMAIEESNKREARDFKRGQLKKRKKP